MKKKYLPVSVENRDLVYGKRTGVTLREAQNNYIKRFMTDARKKRNTKYKSYAGFDFEFY